MRPVAAPEWADAAGGVGCTCDHHVAEVCRRLDARDPCTCPCHWHVELRLVPRPKETTR